MAAKDGDAEHLRYEIGDLVYHLLVVMVRQGLTLDGPGRGARGQAPIAWRAPRTSARPRCASGRVRQRMEPLWNRVDRNRFKLVWAVCLFVFGHSGRRRYRRVACDASHSGVHVDL